MNAPRPQDTACQSCRRRGTNGCRLLRFWSARDDDPTTIRGMQWLVDFTQDERIAQMESAQSAYAYRSGSAPACRSRVLPEVAP